MMEPSQRTSRLVLAGGLAGATAFAVLGFLVGRSTQSSPAVPQPKPAEIVAPSPPSAEPVAASVLGRAELIGFARAAADAFAGGGEAAHAEQPPAGRRFVLHLPFGCNGPSDPDQSPIGWRYDPKAETLRVWAQPVRFAISDWVDPAAAPTLEGVEGFWIARPWTSSERCPAKPDGPGGGADTATGGAETLGVAEFRPMGASRVGRQAGDVFAITKRFRPEALDTTSGFRLRLTGRLATTPNGGPVMCRSAGGQAYHPTCLIAVSLDEVAIENGASGDSLAVWPASQSRDSSSVPDQQP